MKLFFFKSQYIRTMKMNKLLFMALISVLIAMSCGKPHDPESITPDDISGGYAILSKHTTAGNAQDVIVSDSLAYIAQGEGGLMIVDIGNPHSPETVSITTHNARGYSNRIAAKDSIIYIAAGTFGVTTINAGDPYEPFVTVFNLQMKPARNLIVMGDYLFVAVSESGIKIAEIGYPAQPDIRGGFSTAGYAYGLAVSADTSRLLIATGEMGLSIYDISVFDNGFGVYPMVGWCDTPGYAEAVVLDDEKSIAYMACGDAGLQIIDYADSANIHIAGSYYHSGYAKSLVYRDGRVYLAARRGGLQIFDVSDASNPQLIGVVNTESAMGLDENNGTIYVADEVEGLIIVSLFFTID
jgi:hypothetical protein